MFRTIMNTKRSEHRLDAIRLENGSSLSASMNNLNNMITLVLSLGLNYLHPCACNEWYVGVKGKKVDSEFD